VLNKLIQYYNQLQVNIQSANLIRKFMRCKYYLTFRDLRGIKNQTNAPRRFVYFKTSDLRPQTSN